MTRRSIMKSTTNIFLAFLINLFFSFFELLGGLFTNSISLLSDSLHDFTDAISLLISYFLEKVSLKKPDSQNTFGYKRYSALSALLTAILLVISSLVIIQNSFTRLFNPEEINYHLMFYFSLIGLSINSLGAYLTSSGQNISEKVISLHFQEDVLGWFSVLLGSILMLIFKIPLIDPLVSLLTAFYILYQALIKLKEIFNIFMNKSPQINQSKLLLDIFKLDPNIKDITNLHLWSIDGLNNYITLTVVLKENCNLNNLDILITKIKQVLTLNDINNSTIELKLDENTSSNISLHL